MKESCMNTKHRAVGLAVLLIVVSMSMRLMATAPSALFSDSAPMQSVYGLVRPSMRKKAIESRIFLAPFYQAIPAHTGAYNEFGKKVSAGNRLGFFNILATLANMDCSDKEFNAENYPKLFEASQVVDGADGEDGDEEKTTKNYTDEMEFLASDVCGRYSVTTDYEKYGARFGLDFTSGIGLGFSMRTGVVNYSYGPRDGCRKERKKIDGLNDCGNFVMEDFEQCDTPIACVKKVEFVQGFQDLTSKSACPEQDKTLITKYLMEPQRRIVISEELEYKNRFKEVCSTEFEDTHVQLHWACPFRLTDQNNVHSVNLIPYIAVGAWLPTGCVQDPDVLFSLPTGNDGFTGVTLEAALNFAFADYDENSETPTLQASIGSGVTLFNSREITRWRVPTSYFQIGVIPWHAAVERRQGTTWNIYTTLHAKNYISSLSFYGSFVYTRHERDEIHLLDKNSSDDCAFDCAMLPDNRKNCYKSEILEERSAWCSQIAHAGFDYAVTDNLLCGMSVQVYLNGRRVFRPTTLMGQIAFMF